MRLRIVEVIRNGLDRRRFPWVSEEREPSEAEKQAAVTASAALLATRQLSTARRTEEKNAQENEVESFLLANGFHKVAPPRRINVITEAPGPGCFCREVKFGSRKADIVLGLWDHRIMPIECKVSNSALNSIKRLNNDAAVKAEIWKTEFGERQVVPTAILAGVFDLAHLETAQQRGLALFWAHDLVSLGNWVTSTKEN
jgi:hypothetical protein